MSRKHFLDNVDAKTRDVKRAKFPQMPPSSRFMDLIKAPGQVLFQYLQPDDMLALSASGRDSHTLSNVQHAKCESSTNRGQQCTLKKRAGTLNPGCHAYCNIHAAKLIGEAMTGAFVKITFRPIANLAVIAEMFINDNNHMLAIRCRTDHVDGAEVINAFKKIHAMMSIKGTNQAGQSQYPRFVNFPTHVQITIQDMAKSSQFFLAFFTEYGPKVKLTQLIGDQYDDREDEHNYVAVQLATASRILPKWIHMWFQLGFSKTLDFISHEFVENEDGTIQMDGDRGALNRNILLFGDAGEQLRILLFMNRIDGGTPVL